MEFFRSAKPIFIKDKSLEMNFQAGFVCEFDAEAGKKYALSSTRRYPCGGLAGP